MLNDVYVEAKNRMKGAVQALEEDLAGIRTGRANPALVEKMSVEYYGVPTPLQQLASIGVPEPRQLLIRPFDPASVKDIQRAILASDLGLTPNSDGKSIRLNLPPLTEERRKELVKLVNRVGEDSKIAVRNIRRDINDKIKKLEKDHGISEDEMHTRQDEVQKITDKYIKQVDEVVDGKEKEIMEI